MKRKYREKCVSPLSVPVLLCPALSCPELVEGSLSKEPKCPMGQILS
ncbi:MAG: hypothetical protein KAY65_16015 [Planctomycetes bacterium]|nr:hypothetical protein [Planctomycetota bacterium]